MLANMDDVPINVEFRMEAGIVNRNLIYSNYVQGAI
jgi:hypothetical protein